MARPPSETPTSRIEPPRLQRPSRLNAKDPQDRGKAMLREWVKKNGPAITIANHWMIAHKYHKDNQRLLNDFCTIAAPLSGAEYYQENPWTYHNIKQVSDLKAGTFGGPPHPQDTLFPENEHPFNISDNAPELIIQKKLYWTSVLGNTQTLMKTILDDLKQELPESTKAQTILQDAIKGLSQMRHKTEVTSLGKLPPFPNTQSRNPDTLGRPDTLSRRDYIGI